MKRIAIIGASYLQLPLVQKANEMGFNTYCFAYENGAVCREVCTKFFPISITEKEQILLICEELKINAVLSIASDLAVETVNYIAEKLSLVGNPLDTTPYMTNKFLMKRMLNSKNLKTTKYKQLENLSLIPDLTGFKYPLIVKPTDRSGSAGVKIILNENEISEAIYQAFSISFSKEVIIEEFIAGRELSIESISQNGTHFILAITDKVTSGPPHFVELEHHQPTQESEQIIKTIHQIIPEALDALNIKNGASHSEIFITDNNEIYINEIGARMGGDFIGSHLVELSTGFDYLGATIQVALGEKINPEKYLDKHSGVLFSSSYIEKDLPETNLDNIKIIEEKTLSDNKETLTQSSDRHKYFIYQSDKRLIL